MSKSNDAFQLINKGKRFDTVSVANFDGLLNYLQSEDGHKGWSFRGHSNSSWTLLPSLFRGHSLQNPSGLARRHLEQLKIYARGRLSNTDWWGDERYWALGRHYGLQTPLLDGRYRLVNIGGKPQKMDVYRGKTLLIVNVASQCGYTPRYAGLQSLYGRGFGVTWI
jgi:hypothetical protein